MIIHRVFLFLLLIGTLLFADTDEQGVRACFQDYRAAILASDGVVAWNTLDDHSKEYYKAIYKKSLSVDREELNSLDLMSRIAILRFRIKYSKKELKKLSGKDVFTISVNNGWASKSTILQLDKLFKVTVDDLLAQGYIEQAPEIPLFYFIKEGKDWKFAIFKSNEFANQALGALVKSQNLTEKEFLILILKTVSTDKIDDRIFDGPIKK